MFQNKKQWIKEVALSIKEAEVVTLETREDVLDSSNSIIVSSPLFNSDYITGTLSEENRKHIEMTLMKHQSEEGEYKFRIRPSSYTFRDEVAGLEVIQKTLDDDNRGLPDKMEYSVSKSGVEVISPDFEQPSLFDNVATNAWKLYKTVRIPDGRYKFIFRQMGNKSNKDIARYISEQRIQRVIWDMSLNCVNCSKHNSVEYAPTCEEGKSGFTFQCEECSGEWEIDKRLPEVMPYNRKKSFIQFKLKQEYQTAVGTPD
jgi:hypothetical protein